MGNSSSSPYNTREFKKLQEKWYKKLADSGFEDAEQADGNMKTSPADRVKRYYSDPVLYAAKEEYYRLAAQFLNDHVFVNHTERAIWAWHSEGVGIDDIHDRLKKRGVTVGRNRINSIIIKLARIMVCNAQSL